MLPPEWMVAWRVGSLFLCLVVCNAMAGSTRQAGRQAGRAEWVSGRMVRLVGPPPGLGCEKGARGAGGRVLRESVCEGDELYVLRARYINGCSEWMMADIKQCNPSSNECREAGHCSVLEYFLHHVVQRPPLPLPHIHSPLPSFIHSPDGPSP